MQLEIDNQVKSVLEFMQRNVPTDRLVSVAREVNALALHFWGHYDMARSSGPVMALKELPPDH